MNRLEKQLIIGLKKLANVSWSPFDKLPYSFHVTIAEKDIGEKFNEIKKYCQKSYKQRFGIQFDNITILKKPKDKWLIYKEFKIR